MENQEISTMRGGVVSICFYLCFCMILPKRIVYNITVIKVSKTISGDFYDKIRRALSGSENA